MGDQWDPLRTVLYHYAQREGLWNAKQNKPHVTELARRLRMSQPRVHQFLTGAKGGSLTLVASIARLLGLPMESLLPADLHAHLPDRAAGHDATPLIQITVSLSADERRARARLRALGQDILLAVGRSEALIGGEADDVAPDGPTSVRRNRTSG